VRGGRTACGPSQDGVPKNTTNKVGGGRSCPPLRGTWLRTRRARLPLRTPPHGGERLRFRKKSEGGVQKKVISEMNAFYRWAHRTSQTSKSNSPAGKGTPTEKTSLSLSFRRGENVSDLFRKGTARRWPRVGQVISKLPVMVAWPPGSLYDPLPPRARFQTDHSKSIVKSDSAPYPMGRALG